MCALLEQQTRPSTAILGALLGGPTGLACHLTVTRAGGLAARGGSRRTLLSCRLEKATVASMDERSGTR